MTLQTVDVERDSPPAASDQNTLDLLQSSQPGYGTRNKVETALNIVNATVGAGVIGLPYALSLAGFSIGMAFSIAVAFLSFSAVYAMILTGQRAQVFTFSSLAERGLGRFGFHFLNLMLFIQSAGSCVSYFILVADTLPVFFAFYLPQYPLLGHRQLVTIVVSAVIILPLNLFRSIGALARWSALSVLLLPIIILCVLIRAPSYMSQHTAPLFTVGKDPIAALGIMSFAFVCSQVGFSNYLSLRNQSTKAWGTTAAMAMSLSWVISMVFAAIGYLSFGDDVFSNLFSNFPSNDLVINIARLALGLSMILTVPMGFYPAREAAQKALGFERDDRQPSAWQHYSLTLILFVAFLALGVHIRSLGKVYSVVGGIASACLAYIIPGTSYLVVFHPNWIPKRSTTLQSEIQPLLAPVISDDDTKSRPLPPKWLDIAAVILVIFGMVVMTFTALNALH